jgi:peptidoglycan/LPS O-acetylase OafA/YrhL
MGSPQQTPSDQGRGLLIGDSPDPPSPGRPSAIAAPERPTRPRVSERFRGDVAGLRAVAVGLVLLYHAGLPFVPGGFVGVDVFFVISGFLITGQLVTEIDRTGRISLAGFYARRAKRILPAAGVVLVVTAGLTWFLIPLEAQEDIGVDIAGAAIYVINWRLADRAVDYLAQEALPSPVQHYWSLAVEEQFYLVWPMLIIAAVLVAKAVGRANVRPVLWVGLALVAVPSLLWSTWYTATSPERAFFVSTTRMWELAVGAGVAIMATAVARIPRPVAVVLGWAGLAAVVSSALLVTARTPWPGYAAALPTLGTAAVIAAGVAAGRRGPVAILGTRPFRWVGDLSYSLYLWHWPLIVVATYYLNGLTLGQGLLVAAISVVPAWLTFRLVENPLRYSRAITASPRLALGMGGLFTIVAMCVGLVLTLVAAAQAGPLAQRDAPGAAVLLDAPGYRLGGPVPDRFPYITPDPAQATKDIPEAPGCMQLLVSPDLLWCTFGNPAAATKVALVGDSKMQQYLPAFRLLATQNDWHLVTALKGGCPFTSAGTLKEDVNQPNTVCTQWNTAALARLVAERPDYVITSQTASRAMDASGTISVDAMVDGMRASWAKLTGQGTRIIVIGNNAGPDLNVYLCAHRNRERLSNCAFDPGRRWTDPGFMAQRQAVAGQPNVSMIDMFDVICPYDRCPPVIGNVLVYRRGSHLTATYVKTMAPHIARELTGVGLPTRFVR